MHIAADTPGEEASIVPKAKKETEELDVGTVAAPTDAEFLDGDAFLYVKDDHVCMCTTGLRDGAVRQFLYEFFDKANLGRYATRFDLMKVANVDKLKMLRTQGVKEIASTLLRDRVLATPQRRQPPLTPPTPSSAPAADSRSSTCAKEIAARARGQRHWRATRRDCAPALADRALPAVFC